MSTLHFELGEIDVCKNVPPPDPMWPMLMACCRDLLNTATNEFRMRSLVFDKMIIERNSLLESMREVMRETSDPLLQRSFDAADEMIQMVVAYRLIVQIPSARTEEETRQALSRIGTRILCAVYHYTVVQPLVNFRMAPD